MTVAVLGNHKPQGVWLGRSGAGAKPHVSHSTLDKPLSSNPRMCLPGASIFVRASADQKEAKATQR